MEDSITKFIRKFHVSIVPSLTSLFLVNSLRFQGFQDFQVMTQVRLGGVQLFEQPNVEQSIFRNFENPNIKITKDELFDFSKKIIFV